MQRTTLVVSFAYLKLERCVLRLTSCVRDNVERLRLECKAIKLKLSSGRKVEVGERSSFILAILRCSICDTILFRMIPYESL